MLELTSAYTRATLVAPPLLLSAISLEGVASAVFRSSDDDDGAAVEVATSEDAAGGGGEVGQMLAARKRVRAKITRPSGRITAAWTSTRGGQATKKLVSRRRQHCEGAELADGGGVDCEVGGARARLWSCTSASLVAAFDWLGT